MPDPDDEHEKARILNRVDDAVHPDTDAVEVRVRELLAPGRARVLSQRINLSTDSLLVGPRKLREISNRGSLELDGVGHRA
jgi:hypothetical protein